MKHVRKNLIDFTTPKPQKTQVITTWAYRQEYNKIIYNTNTQKTKKKLLVIRNQTPGEIDSVGTIFHHTLDSVRIISVFWFYNDVAAVLNTASGAT